MGNTDKKEIYKTAMYLRLSKGDGDVDGIDKAESNSITNQRMIIFSSQMTIFMGFNNCYILLQKSRQTLENPKLFIGVISITSCIVLYHFTLDYEPS